MSKVTYQDLFSLVSTEIQKQIQFRDTITFRNQLSRQGLGLMPLASNATSDLRAAEIITSIQTLLKEALPNYILQGLQVNASEVEDEYITITAGKGSVGGALYTLLEDVTIEVPFDNVNSVFYVYLFKDRVMISANVVTSALLLAKIIVPRPGTTYKVYDYKDERDDDWQAYIVSFQEFKLYQDKNGRLEEDSLDKFRDNIGQILADNIIGNIRLSEDLKIINTQGSLEMDSQSILIKNRASTVLARFDTDGTRYYNSSGEEIAKFTTDEARVGNILITTSTIQSDDFVSGALGRGFQIKDTGEAEFNDIRLRGKLTASIFEKDSISTVGGNLLVLDGDVLDADMTALDSSTLTISGDTTFSVGDILRIKDSVDDEWLEVTNVNSNTYTVTRDKASAYSADNNPTWTKGTTVVNYGQSSEGGVFLTASENNAPYISVFSHAGAPYTTLCTHARFGNLNGYLGYVTDTYGIGIGDDDQYLKYDPVNGLRVKGSITISSTDPSEAGLYLTSCYMGYFNGLSGSAGWQNYFDCNGNFMFCGDANNFVSWNGSRLCVRGLLDASDICTGFLCSDYIGAGLIRLCNGICITTSTGESGMFNRTEFDAISIRSYDSNNCLKFQVCDGHIEAQDIKLQDPDNVCNYSYLSSGALKFHDQLGDVPYVKRICSGTANTGDTVALLGWTTQPQVMIGINTLYSYNASQSAQNQQWSVYATTPVYYCESGLNYGYCFDVHAELRLAAGQSTETLKQVNFGTSVCTATCVCAVCVRNKFQLWCHGAAPANWYYGTLCYAICYRKVGDTPWCASCFSYTQPHASTLEMCSTQDSYACIALPCMAQWEILACQVTLNWNDSGIASGGSVTCTYGVCCVGSPNPITTTTNFSCSTAGLYACNRTMCQTFNFTVPAGHTLYCSQICLPASTQVVCGCACISNTTNSSYVTGYGQVYRSNDLLNTIFTGGGVCAILGDNPDNLSTTHGSGALYTSASSTPLYMIVCVFHTFCNGSSTARTGSIYTCYNLGAGAYACYCYCCSAFVGDAASCTLECVHSDYEYFGCYCVLDPAGVLNWQAIAYS
jgi:hypothetical protein